MSDSISRQDAIDEIEYELEMINLALDSITLDFNARERLRQRKGEAREILNSIQQLPSAERKGHWIKTEDGYYVCSLCKAEPNCCKGNYCMDCGARMEGEEE